MGGNIGGHEMMCLVGFVELMLGYKDRRDVVFVFLCGIFFFLSFFLLGLSCCLWFGEGYEYRLFCVLLVLYVVGGCLLFCWFWEVWLVTRWDYIGLGGWSVTMS